MRFGLALAALVCYTTWTTIVHATHGPVFSCCPGWSNTLQKVSLKQIVDYTNQTEGACSIPATVFVTKRGKRICSDPDSPRTKKAILKVDEEKKLMLQEKQQKEEATTSQITSAVSTPLKKTQKKKCRKQSRRQKKKKKCRGGRKGRKGVTRQI